MTSEQIAELPVTVSAAMVDPSEYAVRIALGAVRRLMEERKRLLQMAERCFSLARAAESSGDQARAMAACFEMERQAARAIAFAEEAAP